MRGRLARILGYTAFDLRELPPETLVALAVLPVFLTVLIAVSIGGVSGLEAQLQTRILVVAPADAPGDVGDRLAPAPVQVTRLDRWPEDARERLARGEVALIGRVPDDASESVEVLGRLGGGLVQPDDLRRVLEDWQLDRRVDALLGPEPELVVRDLDGRPIDAQLQSTVQESFTYGTHGIGWFVLVFLGGLVGMAVGARIGASAREGFNLVLSVGTPRTEIFLSEAVTGTVVIGVQAVSSWIPFVVLAALGGRLKWVSLPDGWDPLWHSGLLMGLAPLIIAQSLGIGVLLFQLRRDLPRHMQQGMGLMPLGLLGVLGVSAGLIGPHTYGWLALLPWFGVGFLWSHALEGGSFVGALVAAHLGWAGLSLWAGSRLFLRDENPVDDLWRRLRQRLGYGVA